MRFLFWLTLFLAALVIGVYFLRLPAASFALRWGMASAGLEEPQARVTALSLSDVRIEDISAGRSGDEDLVIDEIEADFHWRKLWSEQSVDALRAGPGFVRLSVTDDGALSIGGVSLQTSSDESGGNGDPMGALPFSSLTLRDVDLIVDGAEGTARAALDADYNVETGGRITLVGSTEEFGKTIGAKNASINADVNLTADGNAQLDAEIKGDVFSPDAVLRNVDLSLTGEGSSWRYLVEGDMDGFAFDALLQLNNMDVPVETAPALSSFSASPDYEMLRGAPVTLAMLSGDVALAVRGADVTMNAGARPLSLKTDTGLSLAVTANDDAPFYERRANSEKASAAYALESAALTVAGSIAAETVQDGWRINAPMRFGAFEADFLSFESADLSVNGVVGAERIDADVALKTELKKASFGDYALNDTPLDIATSVFIDPEAEETSISLADNCLEMDRLTLKARQQDMQASVADAVLCPADRLLARVQWRDGLTVLADGSLTAQSFRYRLGENTFVGAPPRISYAALHDAGAGQTSVNGGFRGGRVVINDVITAAASDGAYQAQMAGEGMTAMVRLDSARIGQNAELVMVAPVIVAGDLSLKDNNVLFNYTAGTPTGIALGKGGGSHDLDAGRGEAVFRTGQLGFAPGGLQPEELAPVLRGFVDAAVGTASTEARFEWGRDALSSAAVISLDDISFGGPTRVVNQTRGVSGELSFKSLLPVATDGAQSISVEGVDLDSLLLERGEIVFDMPGDDTVQIVRAEFPWFGGTLGVYDASASMASGEALAPLRVDNIDLNQVLTYIDMDGLSGEGALSGVLPLVVRQGRAFIENGFLESQGPGVVRYQSAATDEAAAAGDQVQIAFDLLRDLRYDSLSVTINGPLDGRLAFQMNFDGSGAVNANNQDVRLPVKYSITLDAALLELLNQANLSRNIELQIERALGSQEGEN